MKYCTNCGINISKRGNRASKCKPCQKQDVILIQQYKNVEGLGSGIPNKPGGFLSVGSTEKVRDMLVKQHKFATLPEDDSDTRQNALEIIRIRRGWRSREEVYEEWGWIY